MSRARSGQLVLVTNRHNVTGRDTRTDEPLSDTAGVPDTLVVGVSRLRSVQGGPHSHRLQWGESTVSIYDGEAPRWTEHPTLGARADLVALPFDHGFVNENLLYSIPEAPGTFQLRLGPTESISVIGFPFGLSAGQRFGIWANGTVASEPELDYDDLPIFLIDCRSKPGQSGAPVVAYRGAGIVTGTDGSSVTTGTPTCNFLGIYSGRIHTSSDIGMVWKASAIAELLATM
ncbi:serine protease [Paraburkholderia nemoris]|uniref:serine protease n=1 Tax=Paraburkholderia nemoris TaxID=2793076 RepID=UPI001EEF95B6|nr:serine protease [Paraburkholderia nemoris]